MSRRAIKAINWAALAERVPERDKANLVAFKSVSDKHLQRMMANPEDMPKLDWAHYKKAIVTPGLVDNFQKQLEALSIPYPADNYTAAIEAQKQEMSKEIDAFHQKVDKAIAEINTDVDRIKSMIPFAEMTMEDYTDAFPTGFLRRDIVTTWPHTPETQESAYDEEEEEQNRH